MDAATRAQPEAGGREREEVRSPVDLVDAPRGLLGRHERRRAEREPVGRDRLRVEQPREPEVEHLDARLARLGLVARVEQVLRLEIPVHDPSLVRGLQHLEHLGGEIEELALAEDNAALQAILHRLALEQLHHQVRGAGVRSAGDDVVIEHLDDARVVDFVRGVPLALESLPHLLVARQLRVQHLDGRARAVAVAPGVHRGHPADADQPLQRPFVVEHAAYALDGLGVGPRIQRPRV